MSHDTANAAAKVHPASREVMPDDPMELHGIEVMGDTDLMMRMLVEEYARMGWGVEQIMQVAHEPFYQGFHGLLRFYGEDELRRRVTKILARVGVTRVKTTEAEPAPENVVQIEIPTS